VGRPVFANVWNLGFNLQWELDFWGQLRRAITAADATLDMNVAAYDAAMVTMLGDIAQDYVQIRTDQERIALLRDSVTSQQGVFNYIAARLRAGYKVSKLDYEQALANLRQTEAQIVPLEIDARQNANSLCTLLGIPVVDLHGLLGDSNIPTAPPEVAVGIPAELVRRRPDVRQAERKAAAQAEQIGIAEAQFYPIFSVDGTLGWEAATFSGLFSGRALNGSVGPQFQWNILNYGRIRNNMIYQDALFKELVVAYQAQVLQASQDAENGIVTFLNAQVQTKSLQESVKAGREAVRIVVLQYKTGEVDFNRYATIVQALIPQQDSWAQAQGQIAQGLIQIYRGLGGGWESRGACMPPSPDPYCTRQQIPQPTGTPPQRTPESIPMPPLPTAPKEVPAELEPITPKP
jgi:NodT family efflux transporter outer membrane factor (OMF) lipoprotein